MNGMAALQPHNLSMLAWRQPSGWSRKFELRSGETLVATLEFQSAFGSLAVGTVSDAQWTLKRQGFFNPQATIRKAGSDENLGVYTPNWTGHKGVLTLNDGSSLRLKSTNFWGWEWAWHDEADKPLVRFHNRGLLRHGADVEVEPEARRRPDLSLLVTLGWYLLFLYQQDSAAVVAAT